MWVFIDNMFISEKIEILILIIIESMLLYGNLGKELICVIFFLIIK